MMATMSVLQRFQLTGRTALVTGGRTGLGRAMAMALAEAGADLAIVSRTGDALRQAAGEIAKATGRRCLAIPGDVTDEQQVVAVVRTAMEELGHLDILVNNAGVNIRGAITDLSIAQFREVQETNLTSAWLMCRAVADHFLSRGSGKVINIGSALSVITLPERTPYASSKAALLHLTRSLALEWGPSGINVNCILPGPFATEMNAPLLADPEQAKRFVSFVPMGRWGEVDEIGGLGVFLASDASSFVTGAAYAVDGGWTLH